MRDVSWKPIIRWQWQRGYVYLSLNHMASVVCEGLSACSLIFHRAVFWCQFLALLKLSRSFIRRWERFYKRYILKDINSLEMRMLKPKSHVNCWGEKWFHELEIKLAKAKFLIHAKCVTKNPFFKRLVDSFSTTVYLVLFWYCKEKFCLITHGVRHGASLNHTNNFSSWLSICLS